MTTHWPDEASERAGRWPWAVAEDRGLPATVAARPTSAAPDWVRESIRKNFRRLGDWLTQAWALVLAPRRFMEEWAGGRRDAMDPLGFFAFGTAVKALAARYGERVVPVDLHLQGDTIREWLRSSTGTTVILFVFGAMAHLVLRRRSHAPFRSTVAAVAYTLGGPGAFFACAGWVIAVAMKLGGRDPSMSLSHAHLPVPVLVCAYLPQVWTVFALAGVHRASWARIALAVLAAVAFPIVLIGIGVLLKAYAATL